MSGILTRRELQLALRQDPPLVANMIDPEAQIQQNGIELTLKEAYGMPKSQVGAIAFDNAKRRVVTGERLEFDSQGWVELKRGAYKVVFNEIVNIPRNMFALARVRSSLLRNGATVETALWDSGFSGYSESLLVVHAPSCLFERNARLIQLVFFRVSQTIQAEYTGRYKTENAAEQLGFDHVLGDTQ